MKSVDQKIIERFSNLLGNEKVRINEPMNRHTTFRIGGPADYFLLPSSSEEVKGILEICKEESLQYFILGNGSNLLVSDEGYRGVIIQLYRNYGGLTVEGTEIRAGAGVLLSQIAAAARRRNPGNSGGRSCHECRCLWRRTERRIKRSSCNGQRREYFYSSC